MTWATSEKEATIELILPDGRVIRLGAGPVCSRGPGRSRRAVGAR